MLKEFDNPRFVALFEVERQRDILRSSGEQTENPDSFLVQRSGDSLGGRFDDPSKVARREIEQGDMGVSQGRV